MSKNSFERFKEAHGTSYVTMASRANVSTSYFRDVRRGRIKHSEHRSNAANRALLQHVLLSNGATEDELLEVMLDYGYLPDGYQVVAVFASEHW